MERIAAEEGYGTRFMTAGGALYTIWVTTDPEDSRACTISVRPQEEQQTAALPFNVLTQREREVAELVSDGWTNTEIAERLCISVSTVKSHMQSIFEKLGVSNRTMLARYGGAAIKCAS